RQIKKLTPSVKEKLRPGLFSSEGLQRLCLGEVDDPEPHGNAAPILVPAYARAVIEQERGLAELRAIMMGVDASLRVFMPSPSDLDTNAVARFRQAAYDYFDDKRTFGPPIPLDLNRAIRNELAAIPLGRELLRFAARNDVDICLDIEAKRTRGVYWLGEKKVILNIRPDVPMMASTLIHELNHAYDTIPVWKGPKLNMTLMDQLRANHFFEASSVGAQWTAAMQWFQAGRKTAFARMDQTDKRINRAVLFACVLDANAASNGALERAAFVGWFANASRIQTYDKNYLKNFEKHHVDKTRSGQYGEIHYLKPWWVERFGRGGKGHGGYLDGWGQLLMCDAYFMDRFGSDTEMEIKRLEREMHPPAP
ncbi:MAG: DUF6782 family putative metallopeptidase, partial [Pseudomonadota bacterium]|nr:DUF6782 family putative metallopeptidase [Pseudomonadota bacterium]